MKRILLWLVVVCLLAAMVPAAAYVERDDAGLEQAIIDSCTYGQKVDISQYQLTEAQLEEVFYRLCYEGKLPWYLLYSYSYYYNEITGLITEFEPDMRDETYDRMRYEQEVEALLAECVTEGMEDWQIALAIHDALILRCSYDETLELDSGYDLLVKGSTICSGYAELYQDLLQRMGIPCLQVESDPMEHVWNLVQLDGKWYHVDVTWDDPSPDTPGLVSHEYFLRTDGEMKNGEDPHHDWETDIKCNDSRFFSAFWNEVYSGIFFTDSNTCYYLREENFSNSLWKRDVKAEKEVRVHQEKKSYIDIGQGEYAYFHTGLSLRADRLWLCSLDAVYSMNLTGGDVRTEYTYDTGEKQRFLSGCYASGTDLWLAAADHTGNETVFRIVLTETGEHSHSFTRVVTEPDCDDPGYSTDTCSCGLTAVGDPKAPLGHTWEQTGHKSAGLFSSGYTDNLCTVCKETGHEVHPQLSISEWIEENSSIIGLVVILLLSLLVRFGLRRKK